MFKIFSKKEDSDKDKYTQGLARSRNRFKEGFLSIFGQSIKIDDDFLEEVEGFLYQSDLGTDVTEKLLEKIESASRKQTIQSYEDIELIIKSEFEDLFSGDNLTIDTDKAKPFIFLVIGVNGAGKTTTIGKLAKFYKNQAKNVLIVAGDTYRAAAVEQLDRWAQRAGVDIVKNLEAKNPSGIIYDGVQSGIANAYDIVIIDTAGRLHTKTNLMDELSKVVKVIKKLIPEAPHETMLVLDGTVGQNGLIQAEEFKKVVPIDSLTITKIDGTAKGGIVIGIKEKLNIPVKFIGLGEQIDDLLPFDPERYVKALFSDNSL